MKCVILPIAKTIRKEVIMGLNQTIHGLAKLLDRDIIDTYHSRRVAYIALLIAESVGFDPNACRLVALAALLHDAALTQRERKNENYRMIVHKEYEALREHALKSQKIARYLNMHLDICNGIGLHHTPAEQNHSIIGNLLFLADNIEASYRAIDNPFAFDELYAFLAQSNELFDKRLLNAFKEISKIHAFWYSLQPVFVDNTLKDLLQRLPDEVTSEEMKKRIAYLIAYIFDSKSPYLDSYSVIAKNIAVVLGYKLSLDMEALKLAALLSHTGYAYIAEEILNKPGVLNTTQINSIKAHPFYTKSILEELGYSKRVIQAAVYHHERPNASGYPYRIELTDIHCQVVAASTLLAALLQNRPYRKAFKEHEAVEITNRCRWDSGIKKALSELDIQAVISNKDDYYEGVRRLFL